MSKMNETLATPAYENLIVDINPPADVFRVTIKQLAAKATLKRGTVLALSNSDGKMYVLGTAVADGEQKFSGDGSTTTFTVTAKPDRLKSLKVGTADATGYTYDATTGVITFATAPASGTNNIVATYDTGVELTANCILADDVEVGTSADASALAYRTGHFNQNHIIVAENYTLTAADKEALRDVGILLSGSFTY